MYRLPGKAGSAQRLVPSSKSHLPNWETACLASPLTLVAPSKSSTHLSDGKGRVDRGCGRLVCASPPTHEGRPERWDRAGKAGTYPIGVHYRKDPVTSLLSQHGGSPRKGWRAGGAAVPCCDVSVKRGNLGR